MRYLRVRRVAYYTDQCPNRDCDGTELWSSGGTVPFVRCIGAGKCGHLFVMDPASILNHDLEATDDVLRAQGYTVRDERLFAEWNDAQQRDHDDAKASGGLELCPKCGHRSVVVELHATRQYGGGQDSYSECANPECDYAEVCV